MKRYVLNTESGVFHDTKTLSEKCNIDQITNRKKMTLKDLFEYEVDWDWPPFVLKPCGHCTK